MPKLEVFFDYACPYCLTGHRNLAELLPRYPDIDIEWYPCEAQPRVSSNLCARGMFFIKEHGADIREYNHRIFITSRQKRVDIGSLNDLAMLVDGLVDPDEFYSAVAGGAYADKLKEINRLVWEKYGIPAVPSYRVGDKILLSEARVGVTKERLASFLKDTIL